MKLTVFLIIAIVIVFSSIIWRGVNTEYNLMKEATKSCETYLKEKDREGFAKCFDEQVGEKTE